MSTLIVPCLGRKIIDGLPQYLLRHPNGKILLERCMDGIYPGEYEKIFIAILESDIQDYGADKIIAQELGEKYQVEIVPFTEMTGGPADTVYAVLSRKNITGPIVIKDSDNYVMVPHGAEGNFVAGLDLNEWDRDVHNLRNKSFLILNEQKNLLDVIEKQIKSDVICLGLYGFRKAENFRQAYERLHDPSYPINKLYVSHIISYLIGYSGQVFRYISADAYENWGDDRLWQDMQRDYTLYFIDLDNILGEAGYLMDAHREKLCTLQKRGASFVGYTTHDAEYKTNALQVLENAGLCFLKVVYGCPHSTEKQFIRSPAELDQKIIAL